MPDDDFEPRRPASGPTGDLFPQLLVEGLARAIRPAASESPNRDAQLDDPPMGRQIQQATPITAVYPVGFLSAGRAHRDSRPAASVAQIGRAACRDRVGQSVLLEVVDVALKKKNMTT